MFEYDKHYRDCQKSNQPFIKARKNQIDGNYIVQLDLATCDYNLTLDGQKNIKKLLIRIKLCDIFKLKKFYERNKGVYYENLFKNL